MKLLSNTVKLSRSNLEIAYSIMLLVLIPGFMVANTILTNNAVKNSLDRIINNETESVNQVLAATLVDDLDDPSKLQQKIDSIVDADDLITNITVLIPSGSGFQIEAASNNSLIGESVFDPRFSTAIYSGRSVAQQVVNDDGTLSTSVVTSMGQSDGTVLGLVVSDISVQSAYDLISSNFNRSLILLVITVLVIAFLLTNHFRFVQYAQLTKKLQEADRLKTDFLSVATHELKAPMTTIKGNIANVLDGTFGNVNDQTRESLQAAVKETDRLNNLVQDLLNVSRIEQGRINIELSSFDPYEIITPIVDQYQERAKKKGITISYHKPEPSVAIWADQGRFQEIITNLLDNAWKYTISGEITIRHEVTGGIVRTRIKDSGVGLSAQERSNLFQRFYRARNEKTANTPGTGLGLWIIQQYAHKMGGEITVDSLEGVGSEFIVELPEAKDTQNTK